MSTSKMYAESNSMKPNNYRANPKFSYSKEMDRIRKETELHQRQQSADQNFKPTPELRNVFTQFQNGQLDREKFYSKITSEMNLKPNEQLSSYLKGGNPTYTGLLRCLQDRDIKQTYTPRVAMGSFTDRNFSHVEQTPSKNSKRQAALSNIIQQFQEGRIKEDVFKNRLYEQQITITPQLEKVIRDHNKVGVSNREFSKAVFSQIRDEPPAKSDPNHTDPSAYKKFNNYDMKLKSIEDSKKQYCETTVLIHGGSGSAIGKRADQLRKFYKGTPDLLDWEKQKYIDEVSNPKKGAGLRQSLLKSSDVFEFNPQKNRDFGSSQ